MPIDKGTSTELEAKLEHHFVQKENVMTNLLCGGGGSPPAIDEVTEATSKLNHATDQTNVTAIAVEPSLATFDPAAFAGILPPEMGLTSVFGRHVLGLFIEQSAVLVDSVEHAAAKDDAKTAFWVAHSLKSTGGSVGAMAFADIAREIEARARTGTTATLADLPGQLRKAYERFCAEPAICAALAPAVE
jgi:HPt (histidine-containing phosphotransfer) domain-containing protein